MLFIRAPNKPASTQGSKNAAQDELQSEADVMAEFNFLNVNEVECDDEDDDIDDGGSADDESDEREEFCNERRIMKKHKPGKNNNIL